MRAALSCALPLECSDIRATFQVITWNRSLIPMGTRKPEKTTRMSAVRPGRKCLTARTAALLLSLTACGSPNDAHLFSQPAARGGAGAAVAGARPSGAGGDASIAGSDHGGSGGAGDIGGANDDAGSSDSGGGESAGASGNATGGSPGISGSGGANATAGSGASAGAGGTLGDCTAHASDATYFSMTQHCYLVVHELSTFEGAAAHCSTLGAHLVTISNEAENAFAWSISPTAHWIGANDGKGPKEADPGSYSWITKEPFSYQAWSSEQPNASATECGDSNGGGTCYEHCAFQWTGGEHDGQWNDRFCLHTIESVCEWESAGR